MIYKSTLPELDIPQVSITDFALRYVNEMPDKIVAEDGPSGRKYTFAEVEEAIKILGGAFVERGIGPGSVVAIMAPNIPEFIGYFHGAALAGAAVTTINPTFKPNEIRTQLQESNAEILVTISMFAEKASESIGETNVKEIITIDPIEGYTSTFDLLGATPLEQQVPVDAHDICVLPFSSGTAGLPKGVMLSHYNLVANLRQLETALELKSSDVLLAVLPFFHIYGMQVLLNAVLASGASMVTMPRFDLESAFELIEKHKITWFFAVPPIISAMAESDYVDKYDISSLDILFSGAASLSPAVNKKAAEKLGCKVLQGFGMTELSPVSHATATAVDRPASSGLTLSNTQCRIIDEEGNDLPLGQDGELLVRGPQVMKGYLNNPEATAETIDEDGWLHTGDIAHFDEDGYIYIVGRLKDIIKYKGFQVAPKELEELLGEHPEIADVCVVGSPDKEAGEVPKAFVVKTATSALSEDDVISYVEDKVASYKKIRLVEFVESIPRSLAGKILRKELREPPEIPPT